MAVDACSSIVVPGQQYTFLEGKENKVIGSYIGTSDNGNLPEPNGGEGISTQDSERNAIGGEGLLEGNIIGASLYGIYIKGSKASWNTIDLNFIGVYDSTADIGNVNAGIYIGEGATYNAVGGDCRTCRELHPK